MDDERRAAALETFDDLSRLRVTGRVTPGAMSPSPRVDATMGKRSSDQVPGKADGSRSKQAGSAETDGETKDRTKDRKTKDDGSSSAFDLWLQRGLRDMFSDVAQEPIPDELLRLINEEKPKPK